MFNLEEKNNEIPEPRTRVLMQEVLSSYQHSNYRSAIVILWTVVIADIVYKLQFLSNSYNNQKAHNTLEQLKNASSRDEQMQLETEILEKICYEFKFITEREKDHLLYLKKMRNYSAHPLFVEDNILYNPSQDETRALIRTAMESLLLKPALLHKDLVNYLVEDLASNKKRLREIETLRSYIQNKFFPNISELGAIKIFQALWRFVFMPKNDQEKENIDINVSTMGIFFERYQNIYLRDLSVNPYRYQVDSLQLKLFIQFLKSYGIIYKYLTPSLQSLIKAEVSTLQDSFCCPFLSKNIEEHLNSLLPRLKKETFDRPLDREEISVVYQQATENGIKSLFFRFAIDVYINSQSFDMADRNFEYFVRPFFREFSKELLEDFISNSISNSQTYGRFRAVQDHRCIIERYLELKGEPTIFQQCSDWNIIYQNIINEKKNSI